MPVTAAADKKINVQKNPRQSFLSLLSLPLAFIIKLFKKYIFLKKHLTKREKDVIINKLDI